MAKMVTILNDFHNSSISLRVRDGRLSASQVRRARRALCGVAGCTCGGPLGERGPQDVALELEFDGRGGCRVLKKDA